MMLNKNNIRIQHVDYFNLMLIFLLCGLLFYITRNYIFWAWDQGNILYAPTAISHGLLPNIDFRSGYLGLGFFIESKLVDLTHQDPLLISQFLFALYTGVSAGLVYLIVRPMLPINSAFGASLAYIFVSSLWPTNNPGNAVSLLLLLGYYIFSRRKNNVMPLVGIGIVVGSAIAIKQNAIYGVLGITFLLCSNSKIKLVKLFAYLSALLVLFITVWRGGLFNQGLIVIIPLILCVIFYKKTAGETGNCINYIHVILYVTTMLCTVFLAFLLVYGNTAKVFEVLNETFLVVPNLIDRDKTIGYFSSGVLRWTFGGITLAVLSLYPINNCTIKYYLRNAILLLFVILLSLTVYYGVNDFSGLSHLVVSKYDLFAFIFHPTAVTCYFILLILLYKYNHNCPTLLKSPELWGLLTFLSFLLVTQSQFVNPVSFSPALVIPVFIFLAVLDDLFQNSFKMKLLTVGFTVIIAIAIGASFLRIYTNPIINTTVLNSSFRIQEKQIPYIHVAEWIRTNTKTNDKIYGYPNFALSFYLASRFKNGFLPNFIGDKSDILRMKNILKSSNRPEYFVVSKSNFSYVKNNPYFYDYSNFCDVVNANYHQVHSITYNGEEVVTIYKAN